MFPMLRRLGIGGKKGLKKQRGTFNKTSFTLEDFEGHGMSWASKVGPLSS
jgi:hypothetical protein